MNFLISADHLPHIVTPSNRKHTSKVKIASINLLFNAYKRWLPTSLTPAKAKSCGPVALLVGILRCTGFTICGPCDRYPTKTDS